MAAPHFAMFWAPAIPRHLERDAAGRATEVTVVAGRLGDARPPAPPPKSWAARADADVAIWTVRLEPGARWTLPPASTGASRTLYFFRGSGLVAAGRELPAQHGAELRADVPVELVAGPDEAELLLLQGRPIGEPVAQYGPFVMNTEAEIRAAFADYQRTRFGGWPWPSEAPVHGADPARFARGPGGRVEVPAGAVVPAA
jgi:redox-sensitive bicupin YhaK (pirin superfamily)